MDELGVEVAFSELAALVTRRFGEHVHVFVDQVYTCAHEALHGEHGYGFAYVAGSTVLVARDGDRLVMGVQSGTAKRPFPPWGWKITKWSSVAAKNRDAVAAWAKTETKDVVVGRIVRPPATAHGLEARGDALLAAVIADPDDAAARLVYADWLLERGDLRGELIRLHQEGRDTGELYRKHSSVMLAPYERFIEDADARTGFVERLTVFAGKLARHPEIFDREPFRHLHVVAMKPAELAKLVPLAGKLARIRDLRIEGRRTPKILAAEAPLEPSSLCGHGMFASVRRLDLNYIADEAQEWIRFFTTLDAPVLDELELYKLPREAFGVLENPSIFPTLRSLAITYQRWADASGAQARRARSEVVGIATLLAQRAGLTSLAIRSWHPGSGVMTEAVAALLTSTSLASLELANCSLDDAFLDALARMPGLERLAHLHLDGRAFETTALAGFIARAPLQALTLSDHWSAAAIEPVVDAIVAAPPRLHTVKLPMGELTADQAARIAATRTLQR